MTNEELKEALLNRRPVVADIPLLGKIEYAYVSEIRYRKNKYDRICVSAELTDKNRRDSTITVDPKDISYSQGSVTSEESEINKNYYIVLLDELRQAMSDTEKSIDEQGTQYNNGTEYKIEVMLMLVDRFESGLRRKILNEEREST